MMENYHVQLLGGNGPMIGPALPGVKRSREKMQEDNLNNIDLTRRKYVLPVIIVLFTLSILYMLRPQIGPSFGKGRIARATVDVQNLISALNMYRLETGKYPSTMEGLSALVALELIHELPQDPWSRDYYYQHARNDEIVVFSLGEDGVPGGKNDSQDFFIKSGVNGLKK